MISRKQGQALELLFFGPPEKVAEKVGVRISTLRRWLKDSGFRQALRARSREKREAGERLAAQAVMMASSALHTALRTGEDRPVTRAALETLKISGALAACLSPPGEEAESLSQIIERVKAGLDEQS